MTCNLCREPADEVCQDGACRECHVSIGWAECRDGTYSARMLLCLGRTREEILENYPNVKLPEKTP